MSIATLILGESGTGKSTSLRNLDPSKTLLIQAIRKPLPFKSTGWKVRPSLKAEGNVIQTDNPELIERVLRSSGDEIVVIDDFQYVMANEYMRRSDEKGFDKFTDIGKHAWNILRAASDLADRRRVYILAHTQSDDTGRVKIKTIGKMLDEKITVEGMFTIVLRTVVRDGSYLFATQNNGSDTVKSPMDMFADQLIGNDLASVDESICSFYGIEPLKDAA
ncbi:ATP-binding protein [Caldimonas sp. KR1-144]|uniref:ATP-binding protein n=1 Tax=Caldimonas sp. KR1-144 TaxID=3400911 RepID=UPI003C0E12FF